MWRFLVCNEMECMIKSIYTHFCLIRGDINTDLQRGSAHAKWMQDSMTEIIYGIYGICLK